MATFRAVKQRPHCFRSSNYCGTCKVNVGLTLARDTFVVAILRRLLSILHLRTSVCKYRWFTTCVGLKIMSVSVYHWPTREVSHGFVDLGSELNDSPLRFEHRALGGMYEPRRSTMHLFMASPLDAWRSSNYLGDRSDSCQASLSICMPSWLHSEVLEKLLPSLILQRDSTAREQI